jgi:hypothetical protein
MAAKDRNDMKSFTERVSVFLRPLIDHLQSIPQSTIDEYRGGGGAENRAAEVREVLTEKMRINSSWLGRRRRRRDLDERATILKDVEVYLQQDEGRSLEFKGSALLDVGNFLRTGAIDRKKDDIKSSWLKTVVAFLNTSGGDLVLGVLEANRFADLENERIHECAALGDRLVCGVEIDMAGHDLDWYKLQILAMIKERIGALPLDRKLLDIEVLPEYAGHLVCAIRVEPAPAKQFLDSEHFYVRRGPATDELKAARIDEFWDNRTSLTAGSL